MRTTAEMMALILKVGEENDKILGIVLEGSRANPYVYVDSLSDFDVICFLEDIRSFTKDTHWLECFGELLIMQKPDDWHNHPYDYNSIEPFSYLMQFKDETELI